ncbi:hypothetical protein CSC80_11295 [Maribacter sp. 6B07]|uniref:hypothetical protein n=1 Tax=Maribacter sp. 6B07 TaxID=2045442 RepID=UPI000C06EF9C|nr:hypothetical protein [Maribacter sp. 6B07]PHN93500.1 hypothetical protein CSC80_11295 [Maribacter sp. 6B07]
MKNIQILILFLFSFGVYAQNISKINADLKLSDSLTYDTEIRIYQGGGITNYSSLFRMFKGKSEKWTAEFYEHYSKVIGQTKLRTKKRTLKSDNDMEFVYLNLLRSHILDLPNLKEIYWKLETRGEVEKVEIMHKGKIKEEYEILSKRKTIVDGEGYIVQAKGWKFNEFEFSNPDRYLEYYPEVDELIFVCEILNTIRNEFGVWKK